MGWSSWNHFHMGVSAPILIDTADAIKATGLRDAGYVYINTDDGWSDFNRTCPQQCHSRSAPDTKKHRHVGQSNT